MGLGQNAYGLSKLVTNDENLSTRRASIIFSSSGHKTDREAFRHAMDNGLAVSAFEESLVVQAHEFFQLQIERGSKSYRTNDRNERMLWRPPSLRCWK